MAIKCSRHLSCYVLYQVSSPESAQLHQPGVGSQWWPEETNPAAQLVIGELGEEKSSRPPLPVIFVIRKERDIFI